MVIAVKSHHAPEAAARYRAEGSWRDLTVPEALQAELARDPQRNLVVEERGVLTVADLDRQARALAGWLAAAGVGPGDVVSFDLPNWSEGLVIDAAAAFLGAVSNPIVPIYRDSEVQFILRDCRSKIVFAPASFRSIDYTEMMQRIRPDLPDLAHVVTVRGEGSLSYDDIVATEQPVQQLSAATPDAPRLLMYTSGTTGRAKGVLHSYNTLICEIDNVMRTWGLGRDDVFLMASPITHITGYLYGIVLPLAGGTTTVLMDRWEAERALSLVDDHAVDATVAATPFLQELAAAARASRRHLPSLRVFACGGAPVPPEVVRSATDAFENCAVFRVYGSTEAPTVTLGTIERGSAVAADTEGFIVGHEVRIVDEAGTTLPPGQDGEILTRGPEMMLGYLRDEDNAASYDDSGYFRTGDVAHVRDDGALVITGRKKDLIIRGGENLSAKEIEDVLHEHPAVREAAAVAMPHARLGETVCVFVIAKPGAELSLEDMTGFLERRGLARQKFPQRLELVESLPRTASGKVQKFILRDEIRRMLEAEAATDAGR